MEAQVAKRFEELEARRKAFIERVRALPADKQTAKPSPKEFSPAEVVMHIAISELESVQRMTKLPPTALKGKKLKTTFIYRKVVGDMQLAKKIGTPPSMLPRGTVTLDQAAKEWDRARTELRTFFEQADSPDAPMQKFILFGTMSASDLLTLYEAHQHYHDELFPKV